MPWLELDTLLSEITAFCLDRLAAARTCDHAKARPTLLALRVTGGHVIATEGDFSSSGEHHCAVTEHRILCGASSLNRQVISAVDRERKPEDVFSGRLASEEFPKPIRVVEVDVLLVNDEIVKGDNSAFDR